MKTDSRQHVDLHGEVDAGKHVGGVLDGLEGPEVIGRGRVELRGKLVGDRGFGLVAWIYTPEN